MSYISNTISGQVSQNDAPLSGALIRLEGNGIIRETLSDIQGNYHFAVKDGSYHIEASYQNLFVNPEFIEVNINGGNVTDQNFVFSGEASTPSVEFFVNPTNIQAGEDATLSWDSTDATSAAIDNGIGDVPVDGNMTVSPAQTTTYTITVTGPGGTATATTTLAVNSVLPPGIVFGASPTDIQPGQSSTLSWTSTNAISASIDQGIGSVPVNGSHVVTPTVTTTYTITAANSQGDQVTASVTVEVSIYDTSAVLTGTVTDYATSQPLADVTVSAMDVSGVPQTILTDSIGKYTISGLRVGDITVSFVKTSYDLYQQTITIPANTTFDLTTQLHQTLVGATLKGFVKDGQTNLPIVGATVIATYSSSSQTSISASDGSYILTNIPLGVSATITASHTGYQSKTIQQTFTQAQVYIWDFVLYDASAVAVINGKITNAKTLQPEEGVEVTFEGSNLKVTTASDGNFNFTDIPFGEQTFYFNKTDYINESITYTINRTPFDIDLIKPSRDSGQISIGQSISGVIQDAVSQRPLSGAIVRVPGMGVEAETDANGNYQLTGLLIGNYPILVIASNYMALNFMANVNIDEADRADFSLIPLAKGLIKGAVTDVATGEPVPGASIEIDGVVMLAATSEGDGTYKMIGVPPGTYRILVTHSEYADAFVDNIEVLDLNPTTIDLLLSKRPATGALAGRILNNSNGTPVSGATVTVSGTSITATTDAGGNYLLESVPAGLNDITVSAPGYPESPRIRSVIADKDFSSPSTTFSDIKIDVNNSIVDEAVTAIITANEGGDIITQDSRFLLHIFPGTLSADARITLKNASDGPTVPIGSDLLLDPALGIEEVKAASVMTQIEISPVNEGDPAPTINGLAAFAIKYAQKDIDAFQLDEDTAFTYSWDGTYFTALDPRPYELAVDKVNNIVYSVMDLSKTITGLIAQQTKKNLLKSDPHNSGGILVSGTTILIKIIGKSIINTIFPPKPKIKIFDKNELLAVINAPSENIPNPNALPLLVIHGFDPFFLWYRETNPNSQGRYRLMLEDIVDATHGVYRPIFVSYNTEAKIPSIAQSLAEKLLGEYLDQSISFKGLPADPSDPASGVFPYLDTFGFSMGGLVSRAYLFFNRTNRVHNMTMIGTPNHGTFNCLKYLFQNNSLFGVSSNIIKPLNFGASDMLDYDDNNPVEGFNQNPFLFLLNSQILSSAVTPQGDINLFAGTDESAWLGLTNLFIASPHDSLVTVKSVFCRPTNSTLESELSLLKVHEPMSIKFEYTKDFSHDNIGKQEKRIREFSEELAKGFSDWIVSREYEDFDPDMLPDNIFVKPTKDIPGYCKSKVKVEYNVWAPDSERQARDFDRVVLVIYHQDGNSHWHISEPKGGENGADVFGNVNELKIKNIQGNSKNFVDTPTILNAIVNFDPNPLEGDIGYDPEKDIVKVVSLVIPLGPGKMTVPLDPTKAQFRTPELTE